MLQTSCRNNGAKILFMIFCHVHLLYQKTNVHNNIFVCLKRDYFDNMRSKCKYTIDNSLAK